MFQQARDHTQPLRDGSDPSDCALFIDQRMVGWQIDALVSDWAALPDEARTRGEFDHTVRQHHERVQAHLNRVDARLAAESTRMDEVFLADKHQLSPQDACLARVRKLWNALRDVSPQTPAYDDLVARIRAEVDAYLANREATGEKRGEPHEPPA